MHHATTRECTGETQGIAQARRELKDKLQGENYHFGEVVSRARELETRFRGGAEEAWQVNDGSDDKWSWQEEEELLREVAAPHVMSPGEGM